MKRLAAVGILTAILTLFTPAPANAAPGCVIDLLGIKVCGTLLGQPLPEVVTVTVRPEPIRIPGPTRTVTVRPEPVRLPGPTETVRIPGPTKTVTVRPDNPQPSALPTEGPTATATETVTASPTGQPTTSRATVTATPEPETVTKTETRTKTETIVKNIALGTLAVLALVGIGILALWIGYVLGYKGAERREARSMRNLLKNVKSGDKRS